MRTDLRLKKILASLLIALTLLFNGGMGVSLAQMPTPPAAPTPPPAPTAPPAPTPPPAFTPPPTPTPPPADPTPTPPPAPTAPPAPTPPPSSSPSPSSVATPSPTSTDTPSPSPEALAQVAGETDETNNLSGPNYETSGNQDQDGGAGASISTGDANSNGVIVTDGNSNLSGVPGTGSGGATIINDGNGSDSNNTGSATVVTTNSTDQTNSANVVNDLDQGSISGNNSASGNTGGDAVIETGDANTTGTIINLLNTNAAGVMISEFNVIDDHMGDLVLDFSANCIAGCDFGDTTLKNIGNGSGSDNNATLDQTTNNTTDQLNTAVLENNMTLDAISGNNFTDGNTGGDSMITTGDSNVSANALNFINNNVAGGVIYGVVNIFGNLIGDIVLPLDVLNSCCLNSGNTLLANVDNGSNSTNNTTLNQATTDSTIQFNNLELENNLILDANSGGNNTSDNTGGNSSISTGDTSVTAQVLNIANNNIIGGNWWLVIVNEAGQWIGHILGADGSHLGGSEGIAFDVNESGEVTVANIGNGEGSNNQSVLNQTTNNSTTQVNDAKIVNNMDLSANSGGNSASRNTNGDSQIETGDANIVANIVNFVNNNITGTGKLFVTVVNVFGSWMGDFVGPGFVKEEETNSPAVGGVDTTNLSDDSSSQNTGGSTNQQNTTNTNVGIGSSHPNPTLPTITSALSGQILGFKLANKSPKNILENALTNSKTTTRKSISLNLAWVLMTLVPVGIATMIIRRRKLIVSLISKKKNV